MLTLRTATNSQGDFEIFIRLYEDLDTSQLYQCNQTNEPLDEEAIQDWEGFDWDSLRYTEKEFEFDTANENIIFVEYNNEVIGFFQTFNINTNRYKFAEWSILEEYISLKEEIWALFLEFFKNNHKRTKEIDVCLFKNTTINWFTSHGFIDKGTSFFTLYLQNHKKEDSI